MTVEVRPDYAEAIQHPATPFLRMERIPHVWCPGCGIGTVVHCFATALDKSGIDLDKVSVVSGIGCAGRVAGYLRLDGFHSTHGRAIPFATGLKLGRPELTVAVVSGDGDLVGIGGNHFIHAARRNLDMLVILINNFTYGMTGGQNGPTTPLEAKSSTMPFGNFETPFNLPHLAVSSGAPYVARWTSLHTRRLTWSIEEALARKGFRFIEVIAPCPVLYLRLNKLGTGIDRMRYYHDHAEIRDGADPGEAAIGFRGGILCGVFLDVERPTYGELMDAHYGAVLGDEYVPMPPEGGMLHER